MRRREIYPDEPPELLRRFDPADWPGGNDRARFRAWVEARQEFAGVHGWASDELAMVQEEYAERRRFYGREDKTDGR